VTVCADWPGALVLGHDGWVKAVSSDGSTVVEVVRLSCTNGRDGEWLRVRRHGFHIGSVRSVAELAGLGVDLAELHEAVLSTPVRHRRRQDCLNKAVKWLNQATRRCAGQRGSHWQACP
jgi:hypothetical protein